MRPSIRYSGLICKKIINNPQIEIKEEQNETNKYLSTKIMDDHR